MKTNVLIADEFPKCLDETWLERLGEKVLTAVSAAPESVLDLAIVGQDAIQKLNKTYLDEDRPTDVLSFAMKPEARNGEVPPDFVVPQDEPGRLGEVIISYPQAVIQANERGHSVEKEIVLLIVHGVLHIMGYDHDNPAAERDMREEEAKVLIMISEELK